VRESVPRRAWRSRLACENYVASGRSRPSPVVAPWRAASTFRCLAIAPSGDWSRMNKRRSPPLAAADRGTSIPAAVVERITATATGIGARPTSAMSGLEGSKDENAVYGHGHYAIGQPVDHEQVEERIPAALSGEPVCDPHCHQRNCYRCSVAQYRFHRWV